MKDKLIIYSGGMDSTVLLHEFKDTIAMAVSFNYGSKHNACEITFAYKNCIKLGIQLEIIFLEKPFSLIKSNLLKGGGKIPDGHYEDESMKKTVVPFRNGIMASIATGIAESNGLKSVLIGAHAGDHAIYPDCRAEWISAMSMATSQGTYGNIQLLAPYVKRSKREIALIGKKLFVDFNETYSCYKGGNIHCGVCGTCTERREALQGFDPTIYMN